MTLSKTEKAAPSSRKKRTDFWHLTLFLGALICIPSLLLSATEGHSTGKTSEAAGSYRT
ncbi:hypothetical protein SAMN06272735_6508 [Streptomyces sp. TLI_55]|nr:hypothetical protein SAMN06272735_6508 [Streptomyces sp. TLI_55]